MSPDPARTLVLLRHGKSAYPAGVPDHDRPLAERGRREAALAGEQIRARVGTPDLVLCSSARRARQTLDAGGLGAGPSVRYEDGIYAAEPDEILDLIVAVPDANRTVLVVGHAPGLPDLAEELAGPTSDPPSLAAIRSKFPTSAFAVITVTGGWSGLPATGRLREFVIPRHRKDPRQQR